MRKNVKAVVTPQPVFIIGTYDVDGNPNAMNAAWAGQIGPNQIGIALSSHKTTDNLKEVGEFTISFATRDTAVAADYVGIASLNKTPDKMARAGWTIQRCSHVNAPYFEELPVTLECKVLSLTEEFGETRVVAEIVNTTADESVLTDGKVDLGKLKPILFDSSALCYRTVGDSIGGAWVIGKDLMD